MKDKRREMTGAAPLDVRSQSPQQYAANWGGVVEPRKHLEPRIKNRVCNGNKSAATP